MRGLLMLNVHDVLLEKTFLKHNSCHIPLTSSLLPYKNFICCSWLGYALLRSLPVAHNSATSSIYIFSKFISVWYKLEIYRYVIYNDSSCDTLHNLFKYMGVLWVQPLLFNYWKVRYIFIFSQPKSYSSN